VLPQLTGLLDLKALLHRGVRSRTAALPPRSSRCSHGLWIVHVLACHAFSRGWDRAPPNRTRRRMPHEAFPRPESLGRQSFSALSGSEDPCRAPHPKVRSPCRPDPLTARRLLRFRATRRLPATRLVFGPLARPEGRTVAPPPHVFPKEDSTTRTTDSEEPIVATEAAAPESASTPAGRQPRPKAVPTTSRTRPEASFRTSHRFRELESPRDPRPPKGPCTAP